MKVELTEEQIKALRGLSQWHWKVVKNRRSLRDKYRRLGNLGNAEFQEHWANFHQEKGMLVDAIIVKTQGATVTFTSTQAHAELAHHFADISVSLHKGRLVWHSGGLHIDQKEDALTITSDLELRKVSQ